MRYCPELSFADVLSCDMAGWVSAVHLNRVERDELHRSESQSHTALPQGRRGPWRKSSGPSICDTRRMCVGTLSLDTARLGSGLATLMLHIL